MTSNRMKQRSALERIALMLQELENSGRPQRKTWFMGVTRQNNDQSNELLDILTKKGLVEYLDEAPLTNSVKGLYRITDDGRRFLELWKDLHSMVTVIEVQTA